MGRLRKRGFIADDGGFTQVGTVIAILLSASLLFATAQAYWVSAESASIQDAADAGALAATNVVGEYMVVARVSDGIVLSMSLLGLALFGVSAVAACIPVVDSAAGPLAEAAGRVLKARDAFADKAVATLDRLQKALPFLCAVNSAQVITANGAHSLSHATYLGLALPVPLEGKATDLSDDDTTDEEGKTIEQGDERTAELVDEAQHARDEMNEAKEAGYRADCDASGSMRERAGALAGLSGVSNPYYASSETWGFAVGLERAKRYYRALISQEAPEGSSTEALADSVARKRFYTYALEEVSKGSVTTDAEGVTTADIRFLPENTSDMRGTYLFTEAIYPISSDNVLHCSTACPACAGVASYASLADLESGTVLRCPTCDFSITTLGKAPAASTSIDNGFEHHYREFARAAERYSEASEEYADAMREAKETTEDSFDAFKRALESFSGKRYDPKPPGRYGCIAIVIDPSSHEAPAKLGNLTGGGARIGPRVAISAAMLALDDPEKGANMISSLLSRVADEQGAGAGTLFADQVVTLWGDLLLNYQNGTEGFIEGVRDFLGAIPGSAGDELSDWAGDTLEDIIELAGLQPVEMESMKPVLVNTSHVLSRSETDIGGLLEGARNGYDALSADYVIATISLVDWLPEYEVHIALPDGLAEGGGLFSSVSSDMGSSGGGTEAAPWE